MKFLQLIFWQVIACLLTFDYAYSQNDLPQFDLKQIGSFTPSNLQPLKEAIGDSRIVLLGEQTHGEGSTFEAKVELIKFLHMEMGFELLAFESGLFDNYTAGLIYDSTLDNRVFQRSVLSIWSETQSFQELLKYYDQVHLSDTPLTIAGFDMLEDEIFHERYFEDLKNLFREHNIELSDSLVGTLEEVMQSFVVEYISESESDSIRFYTTVQKIHDGFQKIPQTGWSKVLYQTFKSQLAVVDWGVDQYQDKEVFVQNPRDKQMAKNLIFLSELYPNKKIICWGASFHFANQIDRYQNTDLTKEYIAKMEDESEDFDLDSAIYKAEPMGKFLKSHFKNDVYSLAFSSFDGTYAILGEEPDTIPSPPPTSIENQFHEEDFKYGFVDYSEESHTYFYSTPLGNLPILASWENIFDGLFYIQTAYPPEYSQVKMFDLPLVPEQHIASNRLIGVVRDSKTNSPIPYAHIIIPNTSKGTSANAAGYFEFSFSPDDLDRQIVFSSIGYQDVLKEFKSFSADTIEVFLDQEDILLSEVTIRDEELTAKDIIKKVKKAITTNYYQGEYNQELFFRVKRGYQDTVTFLEEASFLVYDDTGYKPSNVAYKHFYGQVRGFRNLTNNRSNHRWNGVGIVWTSFSHNLIFDKDNVLFRTSAYEIELSDISVYGDELVYEISFESKRPSAYTTGYGYPAPKASHGKLFVNTTDFAVVGYEHCILRKDYKSKKKDTLQTINPRIRLIQAFRKFDGKYFVRHSKQVTSSESLNLRTGEIRGQYYSSNDLLGTQIETKHLVPLENPITRIMANSKIENDPEFWNNYSYVIDDSDFEEMICKSDHH